MTTKAERTRERLRACALDLFEKQGFDATTVQQVARAAGVSHMTFFRHFATKEAVVLSDPYDPLIARSVAAQPGALPPFERARRGIADAWAALGSADEVVDASRRRLNVVAGHPGLRARTWESNRATQQAVVAALMDGGATLLEAEAAAGACLGALTSTLLALGPSEMGLREIVTETLDALGGAR